MTMRRVLAAFVVVWLGGATATAEMPVVAGQRGAPCLVVENDEALELAMVMHVIARCQDELELSDAQRSQLAWLGVEFVDDTLRLEEEREAAMEALSEIVRPDPRDPARPVDVAAAEVKIRAIERVVSEQQLAALRAVEASKALLTPTQRARLPQLLEAARTHRSRAPVARSPV